MNVIEISSSSSTNKNRGNNKYQAELSSSSPPIFECTSPLSPFIIRATIIASLGGILFGYDLGVVSSALPQISSEFDLSTSQKELIVSLLYLGGGMGATIGGSLCDSIGRRRMILVTDVVFVVGAVILASSRSVRVVYVGRVVVGFAVAVSGIADVAYLHEISPVNWRGSLVSCNEACISLGFLLSYCAGYGLSLLFPVDGWRIMFGLSAVIAVFQFVGMLFMPESPVWFASRGLIDDARVAYVKIHGDGDIKLKQVLFENMPERGDKRDTDECAYFAMNDNNDERTISHALSERDQVTISSRNKQRLISPLSCCCCCCSDLVNFWTDVKTHYRQAIVAFVLSAIQQFCGHPNVLNFAPYIFSQAGLGNESSLASTVLLGLVKFIITVVVVWKIESIERRSLLLGGMSLISLSLLLLAMAFQNNNTHSSVAIMGAMGVAMGYAASFGPLTWLLTSEMFPAGIRGRALGMSTVMTYICASLVSFTFLSGQSLFGAGVPFLVYFLVTVISTIFVFLSIPDTRGKTPLNIEADMKSMWMWRSKHL